MKTDGLLVEALAARIYAERDLLPSSRGSLHATPIKREDAYHLARVILGSDFLRERGLECSRMTASTLPSLPASASGRA